MKTKTNLMKGDLMSNHFVVVPNGNNWAVRRHGSSRVLRTAPNRDSAERIGRSMARNSQGTVSFRNARGQFSGSSNYR